MSNYAVRFDVSEELLDFPASIGEAEWMSDNVEVGKRVSDLINFILHDEGIQGDIEVSVVFVTEGEIAELNQQYRDIVGPTDVLSFECDDPEAANSEIIILGDIVVSPEVAYDQTELYGTTFIEEMRMLITHGMLHLLGYDHIEDEDAEEMEARERELKEAWLNRE
ncbi:MAG: rRNA maturation RNase YbeY [bacterium]|nr:rRNA maturation RNase YbeY [Coriobacteriales bacterium]MCR5846358.1 rRNA maturation RNase YbeY [bacterium]